MPISADVKVVVPQVVVALVAIPVSLAVGVGANAHGVRVAAAAVSLGACVAVAVGSEIVAGAHIIKVGVAMTVVAYVPCVPPSVLGGAARAEPTASKTAMQRSKAVCLMGASFQGPNV